MGVRIGCQTYTWQMSGGRYDGRLDHIIHIASEAGFEGVEPETRFLGALADPGRLAARLEEFMIELPALTLVEDWRHPRETDDERRRADACIDLLGHFPSTLLNLCQMPGADRKDLAERQRNLLACANAIAARAHDRGIVVGYHPNSPAGSVFRTADDYEILLNGLDERTIGYIPDAGHIAKGGMDPLEIIQRYYARVNHVHFKDMDAAGNWAAMGLGEIDDQAITRFLVRQGYEGWIVVEDECDAAITDPDGITRGDGRYVAQVLRPLVAKLEGAS